MQKIVDKNHRSPNWSVAVTPSLSGFIGGIPLLLRNWPPGLPPFMFPKSPKGVFAPPKGGLFDELNRSILFKEEEVFVKEFCWKLFWLVIGDMAWLATREMLAWLEKGEENVCWLGVTPGAMAGETEGGGTGLVMSNWPWIKALLHIYKHLVTVGDDMIMKDCIMHATLTSMKRKLKSESEFDLK